MKTKALQELRYQIGAYQLSIHQQEPFLQLCMIVRVMITTIILIHPTTQRRGRWPPINEMRWWYKTQSDSAMIRSLSVLAVRFWKSLYIVEFIKHDLRVCTLQDSCIVGWS